MFAINAFRPVNLNYNNQNLQKNNSNRALHQTKSDTISFGKSSNLIDLNRIKALNEFVDGYINRDSDILGQKFLSEFLKPIVGIYRKNNVFIDLNYFKNNDDIEAPYFIQFSFTPASKNTYMTLQGRGYTISDATYLLLYNHVFKSPPGLDPKLRGVQITPKLKDDLERILLCVQNFNLNLVSEDFISTSKEYQYLLKRLIPEPPLSRKKEGYILL